MALKSKLIQIPISDQLIAENTVNAELAKIKGTVVNVVPLTGSNSVMVFYNGDDTSTDDTTGGSGSGTGTGGSGTEDPGTGGGSGSGTEDPGTGGSGTEDPGTGGGSGTEDPELPEETIVPIEDDPYEGKFGEYVSIGEYMLPGATPFFLIGDFGAVGEEFFAESEEYYAKGEEEYEDWWMNTVLGSNRYQLFAMVEKVDYGNPDATYYDALIGMDGSTVQVTNAFDRFPGVVPEDCVWEYMHNPEQPADQQKCMMKPSIIGNMHLVLVKRPYGWTGE